MTQLEFLKIVMPFKDKVFRLAKRLLVSREEAEDATQEVILKLWKNKSKIENYKNVEAFSMTMTKNFCLDKLKSKQAQNLKIVHSNYQDHSVALQKQIEVNDSLQWVAKIIAKMLDMNPTAVRVALSRARKIIREKLTSTHNYGVK